MLTFKGSGLNKRLLRRLRRNNKVFRVELAWKEVSICSPLIEAYH